MIHRSSELEPPPAEAQGAGPAETGPAGAEPRQRPLPLLLLDVDGVLSLFGFDHATPPPGSFHSVEGMPHFISVPAGERLRQLEVAFELAWASGWEERANEHLTPLLRLTGELPVVRFARDSRPGSSLRAHWKLDAIDAYAADRPLAWLDDAFNDACERWAAQRSAPTLLVRTDPAVGLTDEHAQRLLRWAAKLRQGSA
ncbi:MAG: HAD domain-containing protein [Solirubrobacteraceae bacterium]